MSHDDHMKMLNAIWFLISHSHNAGGGGGGRGTIKPASAAGNHWKEFIGESDSF